MHRKGLCTCLVSRLVFCCVPEIIWIEISNIHNDGIKENVRAAKKKELTMYCIALCSGSHTRAGTLCLQMIIMMVMVMIIMSVMFMLMNVIFDLPVDVINAVFLFSFHPLGYKKNLKLIFTTWLECRPAVAHIYILALTGPRLTNCSHDNNVFSHD